MKAFTTFINGIGWVTAAGLGQGRLNPAVTRPAGPWPKLKRRLLFADPDPRFGRLDVYSKLGLAAITMAVRDAGLAEDGPRRPVSIMVGTTHGCLGTDLAYLDTMIPHNGRLASPNLFAYTLPNCFLGEAAIRFGFTGACFTVQEQTPSRCTVLQLAMETLAAGDTTIVLAGVCDLSPSMPGATEPPLPGGALFLVLGEPPVAGAPPYGELSLDRHGTVRLAAHAVTDLFNLAHACLPGKPMICA